MSEPDPRVPVRRPHGAAKQLMRQELCCLRTGRARQGFETHATKIKGNAKRGIKDQRHDLQGEELWGRQAWAGPPCFRRDSGPDAAREQRRAVLCPRSF